MKVIVDNGAADETVSLGMLIVFSCELFISCITCDFIISLYCISFTGRVCFFSTVS